MRIFQGVDIVEVGRMKNILERRESFKKKVFTNYETSFCFARLNPFPHFAARFAAKEACLKALGIGLGGFGGVNRLKEIEINSEKSGQPILSLSGSIKSLTCEKSITQITVSLSHTLEIAVATVVLMSSN
ncbi:MAG: holo-ACP synthase [Nitrospinota bacterium]|nr:holo-ACP synthase [Nitrospinota bacterium]